MLDDHGRRLRRLQISMKSHQRARHALGVYAVDAGDRIAESLVDRENYQLLREFPVLTPLLGYRRFNDAARVVLRIPDEEYIVGVQVFRLQILRQRGAQVLSQLTKLHESAVYGIIGSDDRFYSS